MNQKQRMILKKVFIFLFLFTGFFVVSAPEAKALEMSKFFDERYDLDGGGTGGNFITEQTLLLNLNTDLDVFENQATVTVTFRPINVENSDLPKPDGANPKKLKGFVYNSGEGPTDPITSGVISSESDLGYWDSLYDEGVDDRQADEGVKLDIGEFDDIQADGCLLDQFVMIGGVLQPNPLASDFYSDDCIAKTRTISLTSYLLRTDASDKMLLLGNQIQFRVQIAGLDSGTKYQMRIRIEEDGDGAFRDVGSSMLLTFTTKAAGTGNSSVSQAIDEAGATSDVDAENGLPKCGFISADSSVLGCVAQILYHVVFKPTTWVMALTGEIMDWGIGYSISSSSYPVRGHSFVTDGWTIMRDISNIFFIFILVFLGISTIIGKRKDKFIAMVILVALTINFSLFFAKVIVDFGNLTSRFFYNNISVTNSQAGGPSITGSADQKSISYAFAAKFNPVKLFNNLTLQTTITSGSQTVGTGLSTNQFAGFFALFTLIGSIVNLVAAFVFFSLAWLFIARTAGIWLAMIFAPIAFISLAVPGGLGTPESKKYTDFNSWVKNLLSMSVMPIIALLFIYLIIAFLNTNFLGNIGNEETTTGQFMSVLIPLAVISYLLIQTKKISESYAGDFGSALGKVGSFVGGAAVGLATGGVAMAGRKIIGGTLGGAAISGGDKMASSTRTGLRGNAERYLGRQLLYGGEKVQKASFDVRNTKIGEKAASEAGYNTNQTLGLKKFAKQEGGYKKIMEEQTKKEVEKAKSYELKDSHPMKTELANLESEQKKLKLFSGSGEKLKEKEEIKKKIKEQKLLIDKENFIRKEEYAKRLEKNKSIGTQTMGSMTSGAAKGALAGSIVPGIGTTIGAVVGAGLGGFNKFTNYSEKARKSSVEKIRLGQKAEKTDNDKIADAIAKALKEKEGEGDDKTKKETELKRKADEASAEEEASKKVVGFASGLKNTSPEPKPEPTPTSATTPSPEPNPAPSPAPKKPDNAK